MELISEEEIELCSECLEEVYYRDMEVDGGYFCDICGNDDFTGDLKTISMIRKEYKVATLEIKK